MEATATNSVLVGQSPLSWVLGEPPDPFPPGEAEWSLLSLLMEAEKGLRKKNVWGVHTQQLSGITPVPGIEPGPAPYKASALATVLLLQPLTFACFLEMAAPEAAALLPSSLLQLWVLSHQRLNALSGACRRLKEPQRKTPAAETPRQQRERISTRGLWVIECSEAQTRVIVWSVTMHS